MAVTKKKKALPRSTVSPFAVSREKEYFVENLATLISSGTDITSALIAIRSELRSRSMRRMIDAVHEDIDAGSPIWKALEKTKILPEYSISLIRVGEESGRLSENLTLISTQHEKDRVFRSRLNSAFIYPLFVLSTTVIVGVSIAWFIMPRLASVFAGLNIELPLITRLVIRLGDFLRVYGSIFVPASIALSITAFYFLFYFHRTRFIGQALLFGFYPIRQLLVDSELTRLGYILGSLLTVGIPITTALESVKNAANLRPYRTLYAHLMKNVDEGYSFQKSFAMFPKNEVLVPAPIQQMIVSAEQSGRLPEVLLRIGRIYEDKTEMTSKNLAIVLEPVLLVIVWLGVAAVAISIVLPIYSLIGGLEY